MMSTIDLSEMLKSYDMCNLTIATVCSHSSLQIFNGAKKEGFRTLGIAVGRVQRYYDAFPLGKPDEFFTVDKYTEDITVDSGKIRKSLGFVPGYTLENGWSETVQEMRNRLVEIPTSLLVQEAEEKQRPGSHHR